MFYQYDQLFTVLEHREENVSQKKLEVELNPSPYCENVFSYLSDKDTAYTNKQF